MEHEMKTAILVTLLCSFAPTAKASELNKVQCTNFDYSITLTLKDSKVVSTKMEKGNPKDGFRTIVDAIDITNVEVDYTENPSELLYVAASFELVTRYNVRTMPKLETKFAGSFIPGFLTTNNKFGNFLNSPVFCIESK